MLKIRAYTVVAFACAVGLSFASCGGGGGGGGGGAINPPPSGPTPTPSVCPSPNNSYPPNDCTTYTLSGSSTQTITRTLPTPTPPPQITDVTIGETAVVHTNQLFHSILAVDFKTTETDTAPTQAITTNSDNYFVFPNGAGNIVNIGFHSTDSNGVVLDEQLLSGNGIVGQVPCCSGWLNSAAMAIIENDPDGTTTTTDYNADGSYSSTKVEAAGATTITEHPDGSGSATVPTTGFFGVGSATTISVATPSPGIITVTLSAVGAPVPTPMPIVYSVPAWYSVSPVLASDTTTNLGTQTIPITCAASIFGTSGTQLHDVKTRLDTIDGTSESETIDTWVTATAGPVCEQISDTFKLYYDFTGQLGPVVTFSGVPVQTTTLSETVGLQTVTASMARHSQTSLRGTLLPQIAIARQRIERMRQAMRVKQMNSLRDFLKRGIRK